MIGFNTFMRRPYRLPPRAVAPATLLRVFEVGIAAKIGAGQVGVFVEFGVLEVGVVVKGSVGQAGATGEFGVFEVGIAVEVGAGEVGAFVEVGVFEVGIAADFNAGEADAFVEIGVLEVYAFGKLRAGEAGHLVEAGIFEEGFLFKITVGESDHFVEVGIDQRFFAFTVAPAILPAVVTDDAAFEGAICERNPVTDVRAVGFLVVPVAVRFLFAVGEFSEVEVAGDGGTGEGNVLTFIEPGDELGAGDAVLGNERKGAEDKGEKGEDSHGGRFEFVELLCLGTMKQ